MDSISCLVIALKPIIVLLALLVRSPVANAYSRSRCAFGDGCWPDPSTWHAFNESVSGRLIRSVPPAAVCHGEFYDAGLCDIAQKEWKNGLWRTNQTGAYSAILWELGHDRCFIHSPRIAPCDPGLGKSSDSSQALRHELLIVALVPHFSVAAQGVEDIQKAVKFANKEDLYLVVKNTGHSLYVTARNGLR
jgi:hypothetical protein